MMNQSSYFFAWREKSDSIKSRATHQPVVWFVAVHGNLRATKALQIKTASGVRSRTEVSSEIYGRWVNRVEGSDE
jgi:hypothetical protein